MTLRRSRTVQWRSLALALVTTLCLTVALLSPSCSGQQRFSRRMGFADAGRRGFRSSATGLPTCPFQPVPTPFESGVPDVLMKAINATQEMVYGVMEQYQVPGAALSIVYRSEVIYFAGLGTKNLSEPTATPDIDTIFRIGSVSKLWPAMLLFYSWQLGLVSIDDLISEYLPGFNMTNPFVKDHDNFAYIYLEELASHLAGLPRTSPCVADSAVPGVGCLNITTDQILANCQGQPLILPPSTYPSYSNFGPSLLGHGLAESVFNTSDYNDLVNQLLSLPMGLNSTGFGWGDSFDGNEAMRERMAVGYNSMGGGEASDQELGWEDPSGGMYSSPRDLAALISNLMKADDRYSTGSPSLFWSHILRRMMTPKFINPDDLSGFGTPFENYWVADYLVRTKAGNINGFSDIVGVIPELQFGFTLNFNSDIDVFNVTYELLQQMIPALQDALATNQPSAIPSPSPSVYVGTYGSGSVLVNVTSDDNGVLIMNGQPISYANIPNYYRITETISPVTQEPVTSCIEQQGYAQVGEYVEFTVPTGSATATSVSFPGYYYGVVLPRQ
eukprot:TRINITY_DN13786_c0_g1_i1.p1 TRINITY_DN13786_c0_g1~~TRINITY_DN13786_c0_g1_i1.p1  ORF type:complete len:568 (+),score=83.50 TRINITY_DN13786_c0_g1_i1:31-1704(+)